MGSLSLTYIPQRFKVQIIVFQKQAQKMSGLRPAAYLNSYQTLEKLLDLTSHLGPRQLAVRLGCLGAVARAEEILLGYREMVKEKYSEVQREGLLDTDKPLHTSAALYCACKLVNSCGKIKNDRFSVFGNLVKNNSCQTANNKLV